MILGFICCWGVQLPSQATTHGMKMATSNPGWLTSRSLAARLALQSLPSVNTPMSMKCCCVLEHSSQWLTTGCTSWKRFLYLHVLCTVCTIHAVCPLSYNALLHAMCPAHSRLHGVLVLSACLPACYHYNLHRIRRFQHQTRMLSTTTPG